MHFSHENGEHGASDAPQLLVLLRQNRMAVVELVKELGEIVDRALAKRLDDRYQNLSEMLDDLQSLKAAQEGGTTTAAAPARVKPVASIAVLPFANLNSVNNVFSP